MSFVHWLVVLSVFVSLSGSAAYIRDTLAGRSKPNRVSWFLWALLPLIATAAALTAHADIWATIRIFLAGFLPLLVFIASFINRQSYWKLTTFDLLCGLCSVAALIVWGLINSPVLAILLAVIGDGFASIPTILKAWKHPETETGLAYAASTISVLLVIPSIPKWNIQNSAFQVYLLIVNVFLFFAVYRKSIINYFKHAKS